MNIVQLNEVIKKVALKIPTVNQYISDDVYEVLNTTDVKYAAVCFNLESTSQSDTTRTFNGILYYADRLVEDKSNRLPIYADADNAIANIVTNLKDATDETEFDIADYQITHFEQNFADWLAGGYARLSITVANTCDIVLLQETLDKTIHITQNGTYDVTEYSTAEVKVAEEDPIFTASAAFTITEEDIERWNEGVIDPDDYYTKDEIQAMGYVTNSSLQKMSYITAKDLPDYSNTYQAKGDYVTTSELEEMGYVTNETVTHPDYSNTYQVKGDYVTETSLNNRSYVNLVDITQEEYDALDPKADNTLYVITDASGETVDMGNYYTKTEIDAKIGDVETLLSEI